MGKRIIAQRRGKGGSTFRVPTRSFNPKIEYSNQVGVVTDVVNDTRRSVPLAEVQYSDKHVGYLLAAEGMKVGDVVNDYVMTLSHIPEGSPIFAVESSPNSGPVFCRGAGSSATLISKGKECKIKLPSKSIKVFNPNCRATIGIPAGDGRREKPLIKAGRKWIIAHKQGKYYPRTSGKKMNAVDHPYGGSGHGKRRSPVSHDTSPGAKVGTISPRRTGKRKRK